MEEFFPAELLPASCLCFPSFLSPAFHPHLPYTRPFKTLNSGNKNILFYIILRRSCSFQICSLKLRAKFEGKSNSQEKRGYAAARPLGARALGFVWERLRLSTRLDVPNRIRGERVPGRPAGASGADACVPFSCFAGWLRTVIVQRVLRLRVRGSVDPRKDLRAFAWAVVVFFHFPCGRRRVPRQYPVRPEQLCPALPKLRQFDRLFSAPPE